jgi:hypothetical protein
MWENVGTLLSERFIEGLSLALTVLVGWAVNQLRIWLKTKAQIDLTDAQERKLKDLAAAAIDKAEEWAHRQRLAGKTVSAEEKLDHAADHVKSHAKLYALGADVPNGDAEDRIHSELGRRRSVIPPKGED